VSRVYLSHSSRNSRQAVAVKKWLVEQEPGLVDEIYLDVDPHTGIRPGERWKEALNKASARCEAVICLLSKQWLNSRECEVEFRYVENLHKAILCARLEPVPDANITSEWQRCDLFPNHRPTTEVEIADGGEPVVLDRVGLQQLLDGLHAVGIAAEHFPMAPTKRPGPRPVSGMGTARHSVAGAWTRRCARGCGGRCEGIGVQARRRVPAPAGASSSC
jgi:TIR domain